MDRTLARLAKQYGLYYTRYADDLTFSTRRRTFPAQVARISDGELIEIGPELKQIIAQNGFTMNDSKMRAASSASRLSVTGLTVNEFAKVPRDYVRSIRGLMHAWRKHGRASAQAEYQRRFDVYGTGADIAAVLAGHLAFLRSVRGVDDRVFRRLYDAARSLDASMFPVLPALSVRRASLIEAARDFPAITPSDSLELRVQYFRRWATSAVGTLWIVDPWLTTGVVREVSHAAADLRVKEVRFLSEDRGKVHRRLLDDAIAAFADRGVTATWRILEPRRQFHDRWVGDDADWIAVGGPIAAIHDKTPGYSQNHITRRPPLLSQWWEGATPVTS
jgi:hypothetical protein